MAQARTIKYGGGRFYFGNGQSPEVFSVICGFTKCDLSLDSQTTDTVVPDCDNPDAPAWIERDCVSKSSSFKMDGVCTPEGHARLVDMYKAGAAVNCKIEFVDPTTGAPSITYTGQFLIAKVNLGGERGKSWQISIDAESTGELHIVKAS